MKRDQYFFLFFINTSDVFVFVLMIWSFSCLEVSLQLALSWVTVVPELTPCLPLVSHEFDRCCPGLALIWPCVVSNRQKCCNEHLRTALMLPLSQSHFLKLAPCCPLIGPMLSLRFFQCWPWIGLMFPRVGPVFSLGCSWVRPLLALLYPCVVSSTQKYFNGLQRTDGGWCCNSL